jgi:hypothetical protein
VLINVVQDQTLTLYQVIDLSIVTISDAGIGIEQFMISTPQPWNPRYIQINLDVSGYRYVRIYLDTSGIYPDVSGIHPDIFRYIRDISGYIRINPNISGYIRDVSGYIRDISGYIPDVSTSGYIWIHLDVWGFQGWGLL